MYRCVFVEITEFIFRYHILRFNMSDEEESLLTENKARVSSLFCLFI